MPEKETEGRPDLTQMPDDWWRRVREREVERIRANGTTERLATGAAATVLVTMTGARTRLPRPVPLLRVEHEGRYVLAASKGGDARDPVWTANLRAVPEVTVQDGEVTRDFVAREVTGAERDIWWERVVAVHPVMAAYAASAGRLIPVFVLDPAA